MKQVIAYDFGISFLLCAAFLTGCGGGSSDGLPEPDTNPNPNPNPSPQQPLSLQQLEGFWEEAEPLVNAAAVDEQVYASLSLEGEDAFLLLQIVQSDSESDGQIITTHTGYINLVDDGLAATLNFSQQLSGAVASQPIAGVAELTGVAIDTDTVSIVVSSGGEQNDYYLTRTSGLEPGTNDFSEFRGFWESTFWAFGGFDLMLEFNDNGAGTGAAKGFNPDAAECAVIAQLANLGEGIPARKLSMELTGCALATKYVGYAFTLDLPIGDPPTVILGGHFGNATETRILQLQRL